jgi:hypothetical protein
MRSEQGWECTFADDGVTHVRPIDDLKPHGWAECWCDPTDDDGVVVHHSMDQRELYETGTLSAQ